MHRDTPYFNDLAEIASDAIKMAAEADAVAETLDHEAKLTWLGISASWRLLAERALMERTGGEMLLH